MHVGIDAAPIFKDDGHYITNPAYQKHVNMNKTASPSCAWFCHARFADFDFLLNHKKHSCHAPPVRLYMAAVPSFKRYMKKRNVSGMSLPVRQLCAAKDGQPSSRSCCCRCTAASAIAGNAQLMIPRLLNGQTQKTSSPTI